jgi:hypothetical protein
LWSSKFAWHCGCEEVCNMRREFPRGFLSEFEWTCEILYLSLI